MDGNMFDGAFNLLFGGLFLSGAVVGFAICWFFFK
jgi:hypothetical protein